MAARAKGSKTLLYFVVVAIIVVFTLFRIRHDRYSPELLQDGRVDVIGNSPPSHQESSSSSQSPDTLLLPGADSSSGPQTDGQPSTAQTLDESSSGTHGEDSRRPSFYEIAMEKGSDKVTMHTYQDTYERYLPSRRKQPGGGGRKVKLLELGLGCDAGRGRAGASAYHTWLEYFPAGGVELYFIEGDAECAAKWRAEMTGATVVTGDPGDAAFLDGFLQEHSSGGGADFDVVVGGGGHTVAQQMASLETLWKAVRPGGVYFCEYLETSYLETFGGGNIKPTMRDTMVHFLHDLIEDLMYPDPSVDSYQTKGMEITWPRKVQFDEVESISHIDCSRQICAITKRAD